MNPTQNRTANRRFLCCAQTAILPEEKDPAPPPHMTTEGNAMKLSQTIPMEFLQCGDVRLVCGKSLEPITEGSVLLLVKLTATKFELRVVSESGDTSDPLLLASFIDPDAVDEIERAVAKSVAMDKPKRPRRPRKSKAAT